MAFLMTAVQLEDTGVAAYAGAAPSIENAELVPTALGIHSVEARHAAFVRTLADLTSFPNVVDEPLSRSEVLEAATPFIVPEDEEPPEEETPSDEEPPAKATPSEEATPSEATPSEEAAPTGSETGAGNSTGPS